MPTTTFFRRIPLTLIIAVLLLICVTGNRSFAQATDTIPPTDKPAVVVPPKDNFVQRFDDRTLISFALHRSPDVTPPLRFLSNKVMYFEIGVPAGMLIAGVIGNDRNLRENAGYVASSTAVSFAFTYLIKKLVQRPRPFVRNLKIIPVYIAGESSFPSGHTSTTFATAMAVSSAYPKWYVIAPSMLWAGATSYSRMYLGVHYPTDVLGGTTLGIGTALMLNGALKQP